VFKHANWPDYRLPSSYFPAQPKEVLNPDSNKSGEILDLIDEALRSKDDPFFIEVYPQRCAQNLNQVLDKLGLPQNLATEEKYIHAFFYGACLGFTEFKSPEAQPMMVMPKIDKALRAYRQIYLEKENEKEARIFEIFVEIGYSAMRYGGQDFSTFLVNVFPIEI
jgi:hypothetical protein